MLVGWSILDSILFYSACLTTSHLRINEHFTSCTVLLKVSRVQLLCKILILLDHFSFFLQLFLLQLSFFGWPGYWKSFCKIPCPFNKFFLRYTKSVRKAQFYSNVVFSFEQIMCFFNIQQKTTGLCRCTIFVPTLFCKACGQD